MRAPQLYRSLRGFCLGAFVVLGRALEEGEDLPFAFEEHAQREGPALYEYRPLVRSFVHTHAAALAQREDAWLALEELLREPGAAVYARADAWPRASAAEALFRSLLLPLLVATAEGCGGFDWDDGAFDRAYADLERSLFGGARTYAAVAPLVGISAVTMLGLGERVRVRPTRKGEPAEWPEAPGALPVGFGREVDRYCVLELERTLEAGQEVPDAPAEVADAVTALRLATAAPVCAGRFVFERLDGRPLGLRPVFPQAATQPPGEATRLDSFRAELAGELLTRLAAVDADPRFADALDRWERSLFQLGPARSEQLREVLRALLGGEFEERAAVLLATDGQERRHLHESLLERSGARAGEAGLADITRRVLVATLRHGERARLLPDVDRVLRADVVERRAGALTG